MLTHFLFRKRDNIWLFCSQFILNQMAINAFNSICFQNKSIIDRSFLITYYYECRSFLCLTRHSVSGACSWYIFLRPGETVRWQPWTPTSLTGTASQPVASTVKHATWWTTATVAWCTCPVWSCSLPYAWCYSDKWLWALLKRMSLKWVCVALAPGDAPYCTPELYKECADPALGKKKALSSSGLNY